MAEASNLQFSIAEVIERLNKAPFYEQRGLYLGVDVAICAVRYLRETERLTRINAELCREKGVLLLDNSRREDERDRLRAALEKIRDKAKWCCDQYADSPYYIARDALNGASHAAESPPAEPFIVKHYASEERPIIKDNE
jgi:hypothetical protein